MTSDKRKAEAVAAARNEIAKRIARFCTSLSSEEFEILLDRMANVQWKYQVMPIDPPIPAASSEGYWSNLNKASGGFARE